MAAGSRVSLYSGGRSCQCRDGFRKDCKETIYVQLVEDILEMDYTKQKTQMKQNETHHQKLNGLENER